MAPASWANVSSLDEVRGPGGDFDKSGILAEWRKILKVNYSPIFDIARRILEIIPANNSKPLIERLAETADRLLENQLMRSHDLTGAVFQRLIADRKFLAAYYTTPASAALGWLGDNTRQTTGKRIVVKCRRREDVAYCRLRLWHGHASFNRLPTRWSASRACWWRC